MIERVKVHNFQLLRDLDIRIDPSVTAFTGVSEVGKSCLFRAIEALLNNARGSGFITKGESACEVLIQTDKGVVVWNKKKAGGGSYVVVPLDGAEQRFDRVEECPKLAKDVLGFAPVPFGDDIEMTVNLAPQFGGQEFLIFDTGSKVARVLGKFTRLDEIYGAVRQANKELANFKSDEKVRRADLEVAKEKLAKHEGIDGLEDLVSHVEAQAASFKDKQAKVESLDKSLTEVRTLRQKIKALQVGDVSGNLVGWPPAELRKKVESIEIKNMVLGELKGVAYQIRGATDNVVMAKGNLAHVLKEFNDFKIANPSCPACNRAWS